MRTFSFYVYVMYSIHFEQVNNLKRKFKSIPLYSLFVYYFFFCLDLADYNKTLRNCEETLRKFTLKCFNYAFSIIYS